MHIRKFIFQKHLLLLLLVCLCLPGAIGAESQNCIIAVGRDFYQGRQSPALVHGSTGAWEGLTYIDRNMQARPWLAQSWSSNKNGTIWTFQLREGVFFHNNEKLTADHVVQCIQRIMDNPRYDPAGVYHSVASVTATDEARIVFRLSSPTPEFAKNVAYFSSPIVHPKVFGKNGSIKELIATGPYQVEKVMPGSSLHLKKFDSYWNGKGLFEKVVFKTITDSETRLMALLTGQVDAIADIGVLFPGQAQRLKKNSDITVKKTDTATTHLMVFNCARPPFSDSQTRRWLGGEINRRQIIRTIARGAGRLAKDPYTDLCREYTFRRIDPTPGQMSEKLKTHKENITVLLHSGTTQRWPYLEMAQVICSALNKQGIKTRIQVQEPSAYYDRVKNGRYDLLIQPYTILTGEPDYFYSYWIASDSPWNCGWKNPQADQWIREAGTTMDSKRKQELYKSLEELMATELPILPLYHDQSFYAHKKELEGFSIDHFFRPELAGKK